MIKQISFHEKFFAMGYIPKMQIAARSRSQAMDWSLVLMSQGIETALEHTPETGWALSVASQDYDKALETIRLYRLENRGWPCQRQILRANLLFDWSSLAWVVLLVLFFWLDEQFGLQSAGLMNRPAVGQGEWWRLFTAIWLHADISHLVFNATLGFVLLGFAMAGFGPGFGLLGGYFAGVGGNVIGWLLSPSRGTSLGASGMVMGALGLLAMLSMTRWREFPVRTKYLVAGVSGGIMLFVLLGLNPGTDVVAHFGGFVSGVSIGAVLARFSLEKSAFANGICGLLFAVLVLVPWWLAWSHG